MSKRPTISVIIASFNSRKTIESCLGSLRDQKTERVFEIIVVDSSTDVTVEVVEAGFPEVKLYHFTERKYCGGARNFGISLARGEIIAFIDADCTADQNWIEELNEAHQSKVVAVGGAIANRIPCNLVSWASYFCEFSLWMPGSSHVRLDDVAGANMSYKRVVFDKLEAFIEGTYCSDTEFHWRMRDTGQCIWFAPTILITHHSIDEFGEFIRHEFEHGKSFAKVRARAQGFSVTRNLIYVLLFFLIPFKLMIEIGFRNLRNRIYLPEFIKSSPLILLGLFSWSLGECFGYIGGIRDE